MVTPPHVVRISWWARIPMLHRSASVVARSLLMVLAVVGPALVESALAQAPPPQPVAAELPFLATAAKKLDAYATLCVKNGYPRKARVTWLEVVAEYDADDAVAREQLGYVRQGTVWQRRADRDQPDQDNPNPSAAKTLLQKWEALAKDLGEGHRNLALQLQAAGQQERARYHFDRALRFVPSDAKAQAAAGVQNFEGITGTAAELQMLKRSRAMERALTSLVETDFKVAPAAHKEPRLDKASVAYTAVESEHFVVYGDYDPAVLQQAAQWSERALAFCQQAFDGEAWSKRATVTRQFAYFSTKAVWAKVVEQNRGSLQDPDFILKHTNACTIDQGRTGLHLCGIDMPDTVFDFAVRRVVQEYSLLGDDAMKEGIGHAVVGMFFGRNLIVLVAPPSAQGTVSAREEQKYNLPDVETWKQLATDLAFEKGSVSAARLPLVKASNFTNEIRIKAWSFCDYLLRRDPMLLLHLDASSSKARNEGDVIADFQTRAGQSLPELEDGWRRYWTEPSPVKRAIDDKVTPLEAASKEAPAWLEQFNKLRGEHGIAAVGWSAELSTDCKEHVAYLKQNRGERGPELENTEVPGKPLFSNAGRSFASTALVWTRDKDPKKATESWFDLPGYRDAILNANIDTVGIYAEGGIMVMDVMRGRAPQANSMMRMFPQADLAGNMMKATVPAAVDVDLLGEDVRALLQQHGRGKQKQVGYPLTLHFYSGNGNDVQCKVSSGGAEVPGALVDRRSGRSRRTAAPGMWVFYPFEPLDRGKDIEVSWTFNGENKRVVFTAR